MRRQTIRLVPSSGVPRHTSRTVNRRRAVRRRAIRGASDPTISRQADRGDAGRGIGGYVALAGEFSVLAELALRRMDGTLTLGHAKQIDILALNRATGRTFKLEVKTTAKGSRGSRAFGRSYAWLMDQEHGDVVDRDLVYAFVVLRRDERPKFFLVPSADVAAYVRWEFEHWKRHATRRTGKVSPMRMFRIPAEKVPNSNLPRSWRDGRWRRWADNWRILGPDPRPDARPWAMKAAVRRHRDL